MIKNEEAISRDLIHLTNELKNFVLNEFVRKTLTKESLLTKALALIAQLIDDAEILDIRLLDKDKNAFYFGAVYGSAWEKGSDDEIKNRRNLTFFIDDKVLFESSLVYKKKEILIIDSIKRIDNYDKNVFKCKKGNCCTANKRK